VFHLGNDALLLKQFLITPAAGKRLIAKAISCLPAISEALRHQTLVIIAGTTNGYVAEEILRSLDQQEGFSRRKFFRGVTLPPNYAVNKQGRMDDENQFPGDVIIRKGIWDPGKTINDVVDDLEKGDIIIKGANAVNLASQQAAIYIGHPKGGTIQMALQAVIGRRVELILPVGLEKRVAGDLNRLAQKINATNALGYRYHVVGGMIITELQAIGILTGAEAELVAAGGVCGAEGSCWIAVSGTPDQVGQAEILIQSVAGEPSFVF
jgi:hypothetical protein